MAFTIRTRAPGGRQITASIFVFPSISRWATNPFGIANKVIPRNRCALARDIGSRYDNKAAIYLFEKWLPQSGESPGNFPIFFHYVNVGPHVREQDMITDVYLPLMRSS